MILGTYKRGTTYLRVFSETGEANALQVSGADIFQPAIESKAVKASTLREGWVKITHEEWIEAYREARNIVDARATVMRMQLA